MNHYKKLVLTLPILLSTHAFSDEILSHGHQIAKKVDKPASFAEDMKQGVELSLDDLGCSWAIREKIYAFDDAIIFTTTDSKDYASYKPSTVLAFGCWLPPHISAKSGYSGLMPVAPGRRPVWGLELTYGTGSLVTAGLAVPAPGAPLGHQPVPENFRDVVKQGMQVSQRQLGCRWASKPFIYVFSDGVVFTDSTAKTYNVYHFEDANVMATDCKLPAAVNTEQAEGVHFLQTDAVSLNFLDETRHSQSRYIDLQDMEGKCEGRWRWTENWREGNYTYESCLWQETTKVILNTDIPKDVIPGVTSQLSKEEIIVDLGEMKKETGTTNSGEAKIKAEAEFLRVCREREDNWLNTFKTRRQIVNEQFIHSSPELMNNPVYNRLLGELPLPRKQITRRDAFKNMSGANCSGRTLGACTKFEVKSRCEIRYKLENYQVHTKTVAGDPVKLDPSCQEGRLLSSPVAKSHAGFSQTGVRLADLNQGFSIESTQGQSKENLVCTSAVHLSSVKEKYDYLTNYIQSRENQPGIENDPEFIAAVSTYWALYIEKSDALVELDPAYLGAIESVHRRFSRAVFMGHSDEDLSANF